MSGLPPRIPAVQQLGAAVLLQGPALLDVLYLVDLGVREVTRRDGITPSPRLLELHRRLAAAAEDYRRMSASGLGDVRNGAVQAVSSWASAPAFLPGADAHSDGSGVGRGGHHPVVTTREAASILGLSDRQVRRLASAGEIGPSRHGKNLLLDRGSVEALAANRAQAAGERRGVER